MSDKQTPSPYKEIGERLRKWYRGGQQGLMTVCDTDGAPQSVKDAVNRWYEQGWARLRAIIDDLEKLDDK